MKLKVLLTTIGAAAASLAIVAPAGATTFCVPDFHAACPDNGTNVAETDLQTAMQTDGSDGQADTVLIDATTVTDPNSINPLGSDQLTVQGAGKAATRVTSSWTVNGYVVDLDANGNTRQVTMRDLTLVIPATMPDNGGAAVQMKGDTLENVDIESLNPGASGITSWDVGGTFRDGEIRGAGAGSIYTAIRATSLATQPVTVEDATIVQPTIAIDNGGAPAPLTIRRTRIVDPVQAAITASAGTTSVENTVIQTEGIPAIYALANSAEDVTINADHITAVNSGGNVGALGAQVVVGQEGDSTVNVSNSIMRGYAGAYLRSAPAASPNGDANLKIAYSDRHETGLDVNTGDGTLDVTTGNIDADPLFVSPTNLSLQPGSPAIDAGDPAAGGLSEDLLGGLRPIDGDGNGLAVRDMGAYEYQPPAPPSNPGDPQDPGGGQADTTAPETTKVKGPKKRITKRKASFEFSSEAGASFRCTLDGKKLGACESPKKVKRLKPGKHVFTAAAVDAAGNVDATPAKWRFKVVKR